MGSPAGSDRDPVSRVGFEALIGGLSAAFLSLSADRVDAQIDEALAALGAFTGTDRISLLEFFENGEQFRVTHTWCRKGVQPSPDPMLHQIVVNDTFPWLTGTILREEPLLMHDPEELPKEAAPERAYCQAREIRSFASVPVAVAGAPLCSLVFDTVWSSAHFTEQFVSRARVMVEILANAMVRQRSEWRLRESERRYRHLSGRLLQAREDERRAIARDLHDGLSQELASVTIDLDQLRKESPPGAAMAARFDGLQEKLATIHEDVRRLSKALHPAVLETLGLVPALRGLCREVAGRSEFALDVEIEDSPAELPPEIAVAAYRIAQECLHNVVRHAGATRVRFRLELEAEFLRLTVADDGCGFDPSDADLRAGLGLVSLEERAHMAGGSSRIESAPGRGTTVVVELPLPRS